MKIAFLFDIFNERGGAERNAIIMAKNIDLDIYTTFVDWNKVDEELREFDIKELGLTFKNHKLLTYSEIAYRFSKLKLKGYDFYIFSRLYCISGAKNHHPNMWLCHSPIRAVYDLHDSIYNRLSLWQKPIFKTWCWIYKKYDKEWVRNFDKIISNSNNTAARLKSFYGLESKVIHHPIETERFKCKNFEDFYFAPSRLVKEKRIDLIIEAFKEMPDKKLIITGDGPERKSLENLARGCKNIKLLGSVDYEKVIELYSRCTATIYMPINEDYGLVPIESMASGKPCIAANEGGPKETIIHGKTGFLIKADKEEIKKWVNYLTPEVARKMKNDCLKRAKEFNVNIFIQNIKKTINEVIKNENIRYRL